MAHCAEIISVGTELLLGNILNTDAQFLARELSKLGIAVYHQTVVGDNPQRLREAVELARSRADILITTGGLGPTCDDLTKDVLAQVFGRELLFHQGTADRILVHFRRRGIPNMTSNNLQQAYLPAGCMILQNDWGTAPGCIIEDDTCRAIMLPGPPSECQPMFTSLVAPYLRGLSDEVILSRTVKIFGMGESAVEALLRDRMNAMENPTLAPYAKTGEVELRITAKAPTEEAANSLMDPVEADLRAILGDKIYGVNVNSLEEAVFLALKEKGLTLGAAESCTGGLIAKRFTDLPGASAVFKGSLVTYWSEAKTNLLRIPPALLEQYGAVSRQVAEAMAVGAKRALHTDLAVAVTGVAGPDPDDRGNPVGLVYVALSTPGEVFCRKLDMGGGTRERIRIIAGHHAFDLIRRYLAGLPMETE